MRRPGRQAAQTENIRIDPRQQQVGRQQAQNEEGDDSANPNQPQLFAAGKIELTVEQGMTKALGHGLVRRNQHSSRPAAQQQQGVAGPAGQAAGKQTSASAGQASHRQPPDDRSEAGEHGQQGTGCGEVGIGQRGQPLVTQAQVTAENRQQNGEGQPGQKRDQEQFS